MCTSNLATNCFAYILKLLLIFRAEYIQYCGLHIFRNDSSCSYLCDPLPDTDIQLTDSGAGAVVGVFRQYIHK
jgi:hypothetical protein